MRAPTSIFQLVKESTVAIAIALVSICALLFWFFGPGDEEWARRGDAVAPLSVILAAIASILSANALQLQRRELALQREELKAGRVVQAQQEVAQLRMAKAQEEANQLVRGQLRVQKLAVLESLRKTWVDAEPAAEHARIKTEIDKLLQDLLRDP